MSTAEYLFSNINSNIKETLKRRARTLSSPNKTASDMLWLVSKMPWIKAQSNALTQDSANNKWTDTLAKNWVLCGGTLLYDSANNKWYQRGNFNATYNPKDFRPQPFIESVTVGNKGDHGEMREAKMKFRCWNKEQLEIMNRLYMTPGVGVLLQWGWSYSQQGKLNTTAIDLWTYESDEKDVGLVSTIQAKVEIAKGEFDAMYGLISDFSMTLDDDGSFSCETTLLSMSAFYAELPLKTNSSENANELITYMESQVIKQLGFIETKSLACTIQGIDKDIAINDPRVVKSEDESEKDTSNESDEERKAREMLKPTNIYITWKYFEQLLNEYYIENPKDNFIKQSNYKILDSTIPGTTVIPVSDAVYSNREINVQTTKTNYVGTFIASVATILLNAGVTVVKNVSSSVSNKQIHYWRSYKPTDMIIPGKPPTATNDNKDLEKFSISGGVGNLRSVYVNFNTLIKETLLNSDTLKDALQTILGRMNYASGGVWDLQLLYDTRGYSSFKVVDMNFCSGYNQIAEDNTPKQKPEDAFEIESHTVGSLATGITFNLTLPNNMKTTAAIAANGSFSSAPLEEPSQVSLLEAFTRGVKDRFGSARATTQDKKPKEGQRTPNEIVVSISKKQNYADEFASDEKAFATRVIFMARDIVAQDLMLPVPMDASFTIDGIGGLYWGNMFKIKYFPERFVKDCVFTIKDIAHEVSATQWKTTVTGVLRLKPAPKTVNLPNQINTEEALKRAEKETGVTDVITVKDDEVIANNKNIFDIGDK